MMKFEMIKHVGVFSQQKKDKIEYEIWTTPTETITIQKSSGYIENDTTFHITENYFSFNDKKYLANEVWHFKQFANKPDSTNNYIK